MDRRGEGWRVLGLACTCAAAACSSSTGSDLVAFHAAARGPADAQEGRPLVFTNARGYQVSLEHARLHIGAVYLNQSIPTSGSQATSCTLPGLYVGEVTGGVDVDALSPKLQALADGRGTADRAGVAEVWLTTGSIDDVGAAGRVVEVRGTATRDGLTRRFEGQITIGANRAVLPKDPALPGSDPICKQRIVGPILTSVRLDEGGTLVVRVDPRAWLATVDFALLPVERETSRLVDAPADAASNAFYQGARASTGRGYALEFIP